MTARLHKGQLVRCTNPIGVGQYLLEPRAMRAVEGFGYVSEPPARLTARVYIRIGEYHYNPDCFRPLTFAEACALGWRGL